MNTIYFQGIAYTKEPPSNNDCPAGVRSVDSLLIPELEALCIAITKRLYVKATPLYCDRERAWNLLLAFHETVNVKMDRTRGDSFNDMVITISRKGQRGGPYEPVPDAPVTFETEQEAREWVHDNRETPSLIT